jgi:23S rRNA pseudouridine1911/1915/1917 synthase
MALVPHGGRPAVTHYQTIKSYKTASLVECRLETGRTHQIRVHLTHIGHPLVGDPVYGLKRLPKDAPAVAKSLPRQALHATQVTFLHPLTKVEMCYSSPVPKDIADVIASMS